MTCVIDPVGLPLEVGRSPLASTDPVRHCMKCHIFSVRPRLNDSFNSEVDHSNPICDYGSEHPTLEARRTSRLKPRRPQNTAQHTFTLKVSPPETPIPAKLLRS